MVTNNIKILFWLYKSRLNKKGEAPIYLRISYSNERRNISTGYNIEPEKWDKTKGRVKGGKDTALAINAYLSSTKEKLMEIFNEMLKNGDVNIDNLVDQFFGRSQNNMTLMELVKIHNADFEARVGTDYSYSTFEKYEILRKKLELFIPNKYNRQDIRLKDLSYIFMTDLDFYLKNNNKNEHNTATKYLKNLKKIINMAVTNGWLEENPFNKFKATYKEVDRVYLTQEELDTITKKKFRIERLTLVRDLFLFQCYTGLAYSDMALLTKGHITPGIDKKKWIITRRKKTDVRSAIPLLPKALEIISKYDNGDSHPQTMLFSIYSIQKFNAYLHEIGELCGINKNLTSHVGRRTFATTVALANGVSIETISKVLGHSSTKITAQYAVVTDLKVSEDMGKLNKRLISANKKGAG
jgi:integrase